MNGRAEVFVFTSFQGGTGKSSIAYNFARNYRVASGKTGAFIEINLFCPSTIVESLNLRDKLKNSFMDFFMTNWQGLLSEDIPSIFYEQENLFLVPFVGCRSSENLIPRFTFNEAEVKPAMEKLISTFSKRGNFVVFDVQLALTPLPVFLLDRSDAIFYIYSPHVYSRNLAQGLIREMDNRKDWKPKTYFLKNMTGSGFETPEGQSFPNEFAIPATSPFGADNNDEAYTRVMRKLVDKAMEMPSFDQAKKREVAPPDSPQMERLKDYQKNLRSEVVANLEKRFGLSDQELKRKVEQHIEQAFQKQPPPLIAGYDVQFETKKYLMDEILGLGPLEELMRDSDIDEIMVNGPGKIFAERRGQLFLTDKVFNNADHVRAVIDRILMPVGRTVNERTPYVDARLNDGSRVHAIIPPLSLTGPMLTIRRFAREPYTMDDLTYRFKTVTPQIGEFLKLCVRMRKNIVISGGASSGKTTFLNVLSSYINPQERVICIEDSAELKLTQENLGRLESRQQGTEAKTQVFIRDLVKNALRMRPDRIIVGECRGEEALDMLQAMNTGHDGSLTTLHANSTRDALARLETMVLMAGVDLPLRAIREQIASSVNVIVQVNRFSDGSRKVAEIAEVCGIEDTSIKLQSIFKFEGKRITEEGHVFGEIVSTGIVPHFLKNIPGNVEERTKYLFAKDNPREVSNVT